MDKLIKESRLTGQDIHGKQNLAPKLSRLWSNLIKVQLLAFQEKCWGLNPAISTFQEILYCRLLFELHLLVAFPEG